ncbi:hypothetical protein K2X30_07570 [bacterium]|nr:hypothetical protein [bacterium]
MRGLLLGAMMVLAGQGLAVAGELVSSDLPLETSLPATQDNLGWLLNNPFDPLEDPLCVISQLTDPAGKFNKLHLQGIQFKEIMFTTRFYGRRNFIWVRMVWDGGFSTVAACPMK